MEYVEGSLGFIVHDVELDTFVAAFVLWSRQKIEWVEFSEVPHELGHRIVFQQSRSIRLTLTSHYYCRPTGSNRRLVDKRPNSRRVDLEVFFAVLRK